MAQSNLAQAVVGYLCSKNVTHIFGVLAHTLFAMGDAIAQSPGIRFVPSQHEGGAGNMALGYARATRGPAVCLVSAGGGATNLATVVAQANKESVPLFVISSDIDTTSANKGPWATWHGMDHVGLFQAITKQSARLERPEDLGWLMDSLFRQMTRGRQGPVFLCLPADLQSALLPEPPVLSPTVDPVVASIDARAADMAVDLLLSAKKPVILAGTGVDWAGAREEVLDLAELLTLPVASSYTAKGVFPENHPLALGCLGAGGRPYARQVFLDSDLILALGTTFSEGTTLGFGRKAIPETARIIQIDKDPEELGRNYPSHLSMQADVKAALRAIIEGVKSKKPSESVASSTPRVQEIQGAKADWRSERDQRIARGGLSQELVLKTLNDLLKGNEMLVTSGMTGDLLRNVDSATPVIHAGEFRAIGTAFATSLGVKLGLPDARVVCVTGDGSFMMEQQELATARLQNIPVLVIVFRNDAYGGMKRDQLANYEGRVIGTELFVPDLAPLAELFGAKGMKITRPEEVKPGLQEALEVDDFVVIDVKLDA